MKKLASTMLLLSVMASPTLATRQEMDLLILEGQRIYTYDLPSLTDAFPGFPFPEFTMISTANYKGYRATWATFRNQLYLVGLEGRVDGQRDLVRNEEITPDHVFPLKVTQWSGNIVRLEKSSVMSGTDMTWSDRTVTTTITIKKGLFTGVDVDVEEKPRNATGEQEPERDE